MVFMATVSLDQMINIKRYACASCLLRRIRLYPSVNGAGLSASRIGPGFSARRFGEGLDLEVFFETRDAHLAT